MGKFDMDKVKEKVSGVERFARRHLLETLTWAAVVLATFSAWTGMFIGTLGWSLVCLVVGSALGVFFPRHMDRMLKKIYGFSRSEKRITPIIGEVIKMAVALFLPFLYLGFFGIMSGTAYQYYIQHARDQSRDDRAA